MPSSLPNAVGSSPSAVGISLDELFPHALRSGPPAARITGCTANWREVRPGDAYVAVLHDAVDGHDRARRAVQRGAAAVICERHVPVFGVPQYQVEDSRQAWGELCQALANNPSQRVRVIGVAGTHGKSTVATLLQAIFVAADLEVGLLTDSQSFDGMSRGPGIGALPCPELLAYRLARMEAAGCSHAIVEISSRALSHRRFAGIELDLACVTHVTSASLEHHQSVQNYRDAEQRVLDMLSGEGVAVLNADDPVSNGWLGNFSGPSFSYGLGSDNPVSARVLEQNACETIFLLQAGDDAAAVRTSLIGAHQIEHCLAAASAALWYGIDLTAIAQGIEAVTRLPGRMERVACGQDFPLFVDAARSADALRASLRTARQLAAGRVLCVLADAPPASSREALAIREVVRRHADVVILTEQRAELESCWNDVDDVEVHVAAERSEAIGWAVSMAQAGDAVVVTGQRPQDGFQFGGDAAAPCDADVARELLYARNAPALRLVA